MVNKKNNSIYLYSYYEEQFSYVRISIITEKISSLYLQVLQCTERVLCSTLSVGLRSSLSMWTLSPRGDYFNINQISCARISL